MAKITKKVVVFKTSTKGRSKEAARLMEDFKVGKRIRKGRLLPSPTMTFEERLFTPVVKRRKPAAKKKTTATRKKATTTRRKSTTTSNPLKSIVKSVSNLFSSPKKVVSKSSPTKRRATRTTSCAKKVAAIRKILK